MSNAFYIGCTVVTSRTETCSPKSMIATRSLSRRSRSLPSGRPVVRHVEKLNGASGRSAHRTDSRPKNQRVTNGQTAYVRAWRMQRPTEGYVTGEHGKIRLDVPYELTGQQHAKSIKMNKMNSLTSRQAFFTITGTTNRGMFLPRFIDISKAETDFSISRTGSGPDRRTG